MTKSFELEIPPFTDAPAKEIVVNFRDGRQIVVASSQGVKVAYDEATDRTSAFCGSQLTGIYLGMPYATRIRPQEIEESPPPTTFKLYHAILFFLAGAASLSIAQHLVIHFHF